MYPIIVEDGSNQYGMIQGLVSRSLSLVEISNQWRPTVYLVGMIYLTTVLAERLTGAGNA